MGLFCAPRLLRPGATVPSPLFSPLGYATGPFDRDVQDFSPLLIRRFFENPQKIRSYARHAQKSVTAGLLDKTVRWMTARGVVSGGR